MPTTVDFNDPEIQKLLARVEKLLRLASNNPNEEEASSAAAKAQELLALYQLDMSALEKSSGARHGRREDKRLKGGLYRWQRDLWQEVSRLNFCLYWSIQGLTKGSSYEHRVIGRTANILGTKLMADYLEQAIERITRERYDNNSSVYFSKAGIAFREGMAERICERLRDRRYKQEEEARKAAREQRATASHPSAAPTSTALTIVDVTRSEWDANVEFEYDLRNGVGAYHAMMQARAVYRAEEKRREDEAQAAKQAWIDANPEEHARLEAERVAREQAEALAWQKREERNAKRRRGRSYTEKGPRHDDYYEGRERGATVSLDQQIGNQQDRRLS